MSAHGCALEGGLDGEEEVVWRLLVLAGCQLPFVELLLVNGDLRLQVLLAVVGDDLGLAELRVVDLHIELLPLVALGVAHTIKLNQYDIKTNKSKILHPSPRNMLIKEILSLPGRLVTA